MKSVSDAAHMPQLDGLRAFAVVAVAISHWTPSFVSRAIPWGTGVQLFFVLSGFLITGILLRSRPADLGLSMSEVLKVFYIRRILRIFPVYYGVLALCLLFGAGSIYSTWPWHVLYLSNLYYTLHAHGSAITDPFLHLWSLSVEEQFYLLWPLVALVASRRTLLVLLYSSIVGSLLFRISIAHLAPDLASIRYLTPCCLDAFGVGALIAHVKHYKSGKDVRYLSRVLAWIGGGGLVLFLIPIARIIDPEEARRVAHTFLVILYGAIVAQAAEGFPGLPGTVLSLRPVRYLGKISYGLYVYHYFAPLVVGSLARRFGLETALQQPGMEVTVYAIFALVSAMVSWHLYELPINRLKRHFAYPRSAPLTSPSTPRAASPIPNAIAPD